MPEGEDEFLDALYLGVREGGAFERALSLLARQFDCPTVTMVDADAVQPGKTLICASGLDPEAFHLYNETYGAIDPAPTAYFNACPVGTAATTTKIIGAEKIARSVFYNEYFRAIGYEETLGGTLAANAGRFAIVAVLRTPQQRAFDDIDKARLERLMPHLIRALELRRSFLALERKADLLSDACDRLPAGVVALDEEGRAVFVNAAARRMAQRNDGFALDRQGQPLAYDRSANRELAELRRGLAAGSAGGHLRLPRRDGKPPYVLVAAPFCTESDFQENNGDGSSARLRGTLFLIHDPLDRTPDAPELLASLFGLPNGTARVVAALARGEELKAYAERAGISMNTVHFHLKTAYARSGVRGQVELARLATAALRDLSDHRAGED